MKVIRTLALGAALTIAVGSTAELHAQATATPQGAERGAKARGERGAHGRAMGGLFRDITLTGAQKTQVKEIHDRYRTRMQALRPQAKPARGDSAARPDSAAMAQVRTLMASQQADIRAILTPAQQTTFDRNVAQMNERGERRWGEAGARKGGKAKGARRGKSSER